MDQTTLVINGFYIFFTVIQMIIVIVIAFRAKRANVNSLYLIGLTIFMESIGTLFLSPIILIPLICFIFYDIALWSHLIFIALIFYKDKKNPISILLAVIIPLSILHWIIAILYTIGWNNLNFIMLFLYSIQTFIIYGWMAYSMIKSYLSIRNNKMFEPWLKARYLLIITYVLGKIVVGIFFPFFPEDRAVNNMVSNTLAAISLVILIAEFLAWVMPKGLKKWLNRNLIVQEDEKELSEEEIIKNIKEG